MPVETPIYTVRTTLAGLVLVFARRCVFWLVAISMVLVLLLGMGTTYWYGLPFAVVLILAIEAWKFWLPWRASGRSELRYFEDRVHFLNIRRGVRFTAEFRFDTIGHISVSKLGKIRFVRGLLGEVEPHEMEVQLLPVEAVDAFDFLTSFIEESHPGHVFSLEERGERRHSRPWAFAELGFLGQDVTFVELHGARARAGSHSLEVAYLGGYRVREEGAAAVTFAASSEVVMLGNGMLLTESVEVEAARIRVVFADGFEVELGRGTREIVVGGRAVAEVQPGPEGFRAEGLPPRPALQWLGVLFVYADVCRRDAMVMS